MTGMSLRKAWASLGLLLAVTAASPAWAAPTDVDAATAQIDAVTARHHVQFLADDKLEGRAAGSPGGRAAAAYIVRRLEACGLRPGGTGTGADAWFQEFTRDGVTCRNIVAVREGADPARRGEHVLLGAHYDHLGRGESGNAIPTLAELLGQEKGEIHNGADDNASGSAALLECAKAFAALDPGPARTVVLVWFDGEERGLWGSHHYVDAPARPLATCVGMVNMDEVGRARDGHVQLIGANSGRGLVELVQRENRGIGLTIDVDPYMVPNSDHFSFYSHDVPVAFFFTGLHPDYHRPTDDWQKVNHVDMARVAKLAFRTAARLAGAPDRPAFAKIPEAPPGALVLEFAYGFTGSDLLLEVQRDAYGPIAGAFVKAGLGSLDVDYVIPGSPADSAGIQPGDRISRANGRAMSGIGARIRLLLLARNAGSLNVELSRGGEKRKVAIQLGGAPRPSQPRTKEASAF